MVHSHIGEAGGGYRQEGRWGALSSSSHGLLCRTAECPLGAEPGFPRGNNARHLDGGCTALYALSFGSHTHHFHQVLVVDEAANVCLSLRGGKIDPASP